MANGTKIEFDISDDERPKRNRNRSNPASETDSQEAAFIPPIRQARASKVESPVTIANTIVGTLESVAAMRYKEQGYMRDQERAMITNGLAGVLAKLPKAQQKRLDSLTAPIMLAFGLALYIGRLSDVERKNRVAKEGTVDQAEQVAYQYQNGYQETEYPDSVTPDTGYHASSNPIIRDIVEGVNENGLR